MASAFPEAMVIDYQHLVAAMRNDPKDRHVAAAGVKAGAQVVVTSNMRDFSSFPDGIEAQTPDEFLCNLFDLDPDRMMHALERICARRPPPAERRASAGRRDTLHRARSAGTRPPRNLAGGSAAP
jgi:hypothetical protein